MHRHYIHIYIFPKGHRIYLYKHIHVCTHTHMATPSVMEGLERVKKMVLCAIHCCVEQGVGREDETGSALIVGGKYEHPVLQMPQGNPSKRQLDCASMCCGHFQSMQAVNKAVGQYKLMIK